MEKPGKTVIDTIQTKNQLSTGMISPDQRGKAICEHLDSYEQVPSHICRANTKINYIVMGKHSIKSMYSNYIKQVETDKLLPVSKPIFRRTFHTQKNWNYIFQIKMLLTMYLTSIMTLKVNNIFLEIYLHFQRQN